MGDIVIWKGQEMMVTEIDEKWSPPWLKGVPRKKDGSWGKLERNLFNDWTKK